MTAAHGRSLGSPGFEAVGRMAGCVRVRRFWCPSSAPIIRPTACRHPTGGRPAGSSRVPSAPAVMGGSAGSRGRAPRTSDPAQWGRVRRRVKWPAMPRSFHPARLPVAARKNLRSILGQLPRQPHRAVRMRPDGCRLRAAVRRRAAVACLPQASHIVFRHHAPSHDRRDALWRSQGCPRPGRRRASGDIAREHPRAPDDPVPQPIRTS